jgi:predicted ATP-grasp superfamily ATP-dependent carboligase
MAIQERVVLPQLKDPVLISAFAAAHKGGGTATGALEYLLNAWGAQQVAEFDAEECYNYARIRPYVVRQNGEATISWPTNTVYLVNPPESERSFLFLIGVEPSMHWRSFAEGIAQFAARAGVKTAIALRSMPGSVAHTQPAQLQAIYSNAKMAEGFGITPIADSHGPLDIGGLINLTLSAMGCDTVDILALEPFYTNAVPDARAGLAMLDALGGAFGWQLPREQLAAMAEAQYAAIEASVSASEQAQALVRALEQQAGGGAAKQQMALLETPLQATDAAAAVDEVEAMLRESRSQSE